MPRTEPKPRKRLGRGLGSLMAAPVRIDVTPAAKPDKAADSTTSPVESPKQPADVASTPVAEAPSPSTDGDRVQLIPLDRIQPNRHQPRQVFDEGALDRLAESIRNDGLMQPVLVRPTDSGGYELIAGERRWRAAQRIPLETIPAIVRDINERTAAEWALIENLQREDLNPIERAEAFRQLVERFGLTHQGLAERVGLDRSSITNLLRLNELDEVCKAAVRSGAIGLGHARSLLAITNKEARQVLCREAIRRQWSVRELERRVRGSSSGNGVDGADTAPSPKRGSGGAGLNAHLADLEKRLGEHLGTRVQVVRGKKKGSGKVVIEFYDLDQFEGLMSRLGYKDSD